MQTMSTTTQTREAIPTGTWTTDPVHSDLAFSIDYMAGTFRGTFSKFTATISDGTIRGAAGVASVQVKDPTLEAHLQSPDFFDAERNPQLKLESKDVARSGDEVVVDAELTIKGHTEPVELRGTISEPMSDPFGNERFGAKLRTTIDRTAYGITWNNPLPSGEPALSNEVEIVADLQFVKAS
jgi:polyisoprenoid-binding protein YceI